MAPHPHPHLDPSPNPDPAPEQVGRLSSEGVEVSLAALLPQLTSLDQEHAAALREFVGLCGEVDLLRLVRVRGGANPNPIPSSAARWTSPSSPHSTPYLRTYLG